MESRCKCPATNGTVLNNSFARSFKDCIGLIGASGFTVSGNTMTDCARGGDHHSAILLQGETTQNTQNNTIEDNIIIDNQANPYIWYAIKEVDAESHIATGNTIQNNQVYNYRVLPVHLAGHTSTESDNGGG